MAARDVRDPWWVPVPMDLPPWPRRAALCVNPEGLATVPEVEAALRHSAAAQTEAGWDVVETDMPPIREPAKLDILLWMAEMRRGGGKMVEQENDPDANHVYRMLCEVVDAPDINELLDTIQRRAGLLREWMEFFEDFPVLICPVSAELPFPNNLDVESDDAFRRCFEAQIIQIGLPFMGLPGLTVTTGQAAGAPVGVQLVAGRYREDILLAAGRDIEARSPAVVPVDPA
jgi:amidase